MSKRPLITEPLRLSQEEAGLLVAAAVFKGDPERLDELLKAGADPDSVGLYPAWSEGSMSALEAAISRRLFSLARILLKAGATPNGGASESGKSPLEICCYESQIIGWRRDQRGLQEACDLARELIAAGADPHQSAVWEALLAGPLMAPGSMFAPLAEAGVDIDKLAESGRSPLGTAARLGNLKIAQELLELGADPMLSAPEGGKAISPMMEAKARKERSMEEMFNSEIARRALEAELPAGAKKPSSSL